MGRMKKLFLRLADATSQGNTRYLSSPQHSAMMRQPKEKAASPCWDASSHVSRAAGPMVKKARGRCQPSSAWIWLGEASSCPWPSYTQCSALASPPLESFPDHLLNMDHLPSPTTSLLSLLLYSFLEGNLLESLGCQLHEESLSVSSASVVR